MILLVAMIGAIVLTFRQREGVKKQSYIKQISRERSEGVEVLEVNLIKELKLMIEIGLGHYLTLGAIYFYNWCNWNFFK
jgi:hypothetical protein